MTIRLRLSPINCEGCITLLPAKIWVCARYAPVSATYLQYLQPAQVLLASKLHCAPGSLARHTPVGTAPPTRRRHRS